MCVVEMMILSCLFAFVVLSADKIKMMKQNQKRNQHKKKETDGDALSISLKVQEVV